jgi:hypothetical protein
LKNISNKFNRRNNYGASLALVAMCAFALVLFIVACFQLMMIFGGKQELNNTADAAALNVAQRAIQIKTSPGDLFSDCADSQGTIGLANINRVWGKAYLINANVEEMTANQQLTNLATDAANNTYNSAQQVNDDLCTNLKNMPTLTSFFDQIASLRLHRMLGNKQVSSDTNTDWNTAMLYRGDQSNLSANFSQIPSPTNARFNTVSTGNTSYLPGYMPMQCNDKNFYFVTFHNGERTHLVTESYFVRSSQDKAALLTVQNPIPNAFSGHGTTENSFSSQSFAVANPQIQYNLAIPHAYVSITLQNLAYWFVQGKQVNVTTYGFSKETQFGAKQIPLSKKNDYLDGYASLGNEFSVGTNLWSAINSLSSNSTDVLTKLLQRMQEVDSNFTQNDLQQLLQQQQIDPTTNTYVIYPNYKNPDNTAPTIKVGPLIAGKKKTLPTWLSTAAINEGQAKIIIDKPPVQDDPNYNWEQVFGPNFEQSQHWTEVGGHIDWTPGTGASQTLGRLTAVHTTKCYFTAVPKNNNNN